MIELSQDDLDALARCLRLLAARGRQLRQARDASEPPSDTASATEPATPALNDSGIYERDEVTLDCNSWPGQARS